MARKISEDRPVRYEHGTYQIQRSRGWFRYDTRAVFVDDPDGCRGHGNSKEEALADLRRYASL